MRGWFLVLALLVWAAPAAAQAAGPYTPEGIRLREQFWLIPTGDVRVPLMRAVVFRPPGEERRPLAILAHGTLDNEEAREAMPMLSLFPLTRLLVQRGHVVVIPIRRGYGATGGPYGEAAGACAQSDFLRPAREGARDLAATATFMRQQPFVGSDLLVAGQAGSALTALAFAAERPAGLSQVIAFAPGRGARREGTRTTWCGYDVLRDTFAAFGLRARAPALFVHAQNDPLYPPDMVAEMVGAYSAGGAPATRRLLPPVGTDGHDLLGTFEGPEAWLPVVVEALGTPR
jgi:dienelactone hydrolase